MNIYQARLKLEQLKNSPKYEAMIKTAAIITKLLEEHKIKPVIVGGLSVEIYTQQAYTTRDIDFVSDGYHIIEDILFDLGFKKEGRHFYHEEIEIAIEIPDNNLEGDYERVIKVTLDDYGFVYLISVEDIILDRLRAGVHWKSEEDQIWGFKLLSSNFFSVDIDYLYEKIESKEEKELLDEWFAQLQNNS